MHGRQGQRFMAALEGETDLMGWREKARRAIAWGIEPDALEWRVAGRAATLDLEPLAPLPKGLPRDAAPLRIARDLLALINTALLHSDPDRFALAYRLVWRAHRRPGSHRNPADPDVARLAALAKNVRRDIHKMHAFVRFRKTGSETGSGREQFIAWFEPMHHITEAVAPFFRDRFTGMDWVIVTPERSIGWDGQRLLYGPGGDRSALPPDDAVEAEWRAYYAGIFNPARVKVKAMKAEMPVRYWKNLPEAELIGTLIAEAGARVDGMIDASADALDAEAPLTLDTQPPAFASLAALYAALAAGDAPREGFAERLVPGEGPADAAILLVGEQPGDEEEREGRPFVGPAGHLLDEALAAAGIDRSACYVTNAVKRFKFVARGKRRIHQKPSAGDIAHYRPWLFAERALIAPRVTIALGATAVHALLGKPLAIERHRGTVRDLADGGALLITAHPSYVLRLPDASAQRIAFDAMVRDLSQAAALARQTAAGAKN